MIVKPKLQVTGLIIELTLDEALLIAQEPDRADRVREEARAVLSASGVDPDTGERKEAVLGLSADRKQLPASASTGEAKGGNSRPFRRQDGTHGSQKAKTAKCPKCKRELKNEAGVKIHLARFCPVVQREEKLKEAEEHYSKRGENGSKENSQKPKDRRQALEEQWESLAEGDGDAEDQGE